MSKVVITGINGFVGHHLARELHGQGHDVVGISQGPSLAPELADVVDTYLSCNLTDQTAVDRLPLEGVQAIINLAGLANVGASFEDPELYMKVNVGTLSTLGQAILSRGLTCRLVAVSTGGVYDPTGQPPFTETSKVVDVDKTNPYVVSKLAMEKQAQAFAQQEMDCLIIRPFNHTGPGQLKGFLLPDLVEGIKKSLGTGTPLAIGDLSTERDYTDVRDIAKAYCLLALADRKSLRQITYNIASGRSVSGQEILKLLSTELSPDKSVETQVDPSRIRPNDAPVIFGDHSALSRDTGWQPTIPLNQTIKDFIKLA